MLMSGRRPKRGLSMVVADVGVWSGNAFHVEVAPLAVTQGVEWLKRPG